MVADLDKNSCVPGRSQILVIPAGGPDWAVISASLGNADLLPVKLTEIRHIVQVVIVSQGNQSFPLLLIFSLSLYCLQPEFQPDVAYKTFLPFPYYGLDRLLYNTIF